MIALLRRLALVLAVCLAAASPAHVVRAHGALAQVAAHGAVAAIGVIGADEVGSIGRGFLRGRTATAWNAMLSLPNLLAGYSVDSAAGRWQDSARTTLAATNGDRIGAIDDLSGNGKHLKQTSSTVRGTLNTSGVNTHPSCTFDGVTQTLLTTATIQPAAVTIYVVFKRTGTMGYVAAYGDSSSFSNGGGYLYMPGSNSSQEYRTGGTLGISVAVPTIGTAVLWTMSDTADNTGSNLKLRIDAGSDTTGTASFGTMTAAGVVSVAADPSSTTPSAMEFAALWIYGSAHGNTDKATAHTTLAAEWGTP